MKLHQATRYAIWSIIELASRPGEQVAASELAAKYRISQHHLAKVLRTLSRARMVASTRGPTGGCIFIGNAKRLTLYDVISLFEEDESADVQGADTPVAREVIRVLGEIDRITTATLRSVTIQTIIKNAGRAKARTADPQGDATHFSRIKNLTE
jgi:Rrf2 family nitric oxide-sensitive transcriptional repressor